MKSAIEIKRMNESEIYVKLNALHVWFTRIKSERQRRMHHENGFRRALTLFGIAHTHQVDVNGVCRIIYTEFSGKFRSKKAFFERQFSFRWQIARTLLKNVKLKWFTISFHMLRLRQKPSFFCVLIFFSAYNWTQTVIVNELGNGLIMPACIIEPARINTSFCAFDSKT